MKLQLRNLIERVLMARPDASASDIRNMVPQIRDLSDDEIAEIVDPMRNQQAGGKGPPSRR